MRKRSGRWPRNYDTRIWRCWNRWRSDECGNRPLGAAASGARRKQAIRHGGGRRRVEFHDHHQVTQSPDGLLVFDEALTRFASEEPAKAELVKLRFFAGLSTPEAAAALGISIATTERWWAFARAWLLSELQEEKGQEILPSG
jgi:DNA-directed RNA polymerase specialized sigma24 family protein